MIKTKVQAYDGLRTTYAYEVWVDERLCVRGAVVCTFAYAKKGFGQFLSGAVCRNGTQFMRELNILSLALSAAALG